MLPIGVNVAVLNEGQILLTKRDDFEVWCLPGGGVEEGESLAQAAIRETKEETGLDVELTSLVGVYSRVGDFLPNHVILFAAQPVGGVIQVQPGETIDVGFFPFDQIPDDLSLGQGDRIQDAIHQSGGSIVVTQEVILKEDAKKALQELAEVRKLPRESRISYYRSMAQQATTRVKIDIGE